MANEDIGIVKYVANGEKVSLSPAMVRKYLVRGNTEVTDQEIIMFMSLAKYQHLNPFLNEAYMIKFKGAPAQIITSKEAFMKRANSNPHYLGTDAGIIVQRGDEMKQLSGTVKLKNDILIGAWANVKRDDRDDTHIEVSMDEFSKGQSTWKSMPATMIRKVAVVNALREAFPDALGGMYTEDDSQQFNDKRDVTEKRTKPSTVDGLLNESKTEVKHDDNSNTGTTEPDIDQGNLFEQAPPEEAPMAPDQG